MPPTLYSYAILFGAQIAVGAAAIFARYALHGAGPLAVSSMRLVIAAAPLLIAAIVVGKKQQLKINKKNELTLSLCGLALAVHLATWIGSLLYTSVAVSTLLVCTSPVWTALYDSLVLKQKMGRQFWLAFGAAGAGVALIVNSRGTIAPTPGKEPLGYGLALSGSVAIAAYLIMARSLNNSYPTVVIVGRTYSWAALFLGLAALSVGQRPPPFIDTFSWGGIIAMAMISQLLGHTGINACLRWFSTSIVAFSTLLEPVFAAALAAAIFGEKLSPGTIFGSAIVLAALAVILMRQPEKRKLEQIEESNQL